MTYMPVAEHAVDDKGVPLSWPSRLAFTDWLDKQVSDAVDRAVAHERARVARREAEWRVNEGANHMALAKRLLWDDEFVAAVAHVTSEAGL